MIIIVLLSFLKFLTMVILCVTNCRSDSVCKLPPVCKEYPGLASPGSAGIDHNSARPLDETSSTVTHSTGEGREGKNERKTLTNGRYVRVEVCREI